MTSHNHPAGQPATAWQRYLASEHAARDAYLATTHHAHLEYLTGPWPDRDAYNAVEVSAWMTYYAAGRAAWQTYRAETAASLRSPARSNEYTTRHVCISTPCPECGYNQDTAPTPTRDAAGEVWPADPPTSSQPIQIPVYPTDHRTDQEAHASWEPKFYPATGGNE